jgi:hypothetical protein
MVDRDAKRKLVNPPRCRDFRLAASLLLQLLVISAVSLVAVRGMAAPPFENRESQLHVCRTAHFLIQHDASPAWGIALGEHLESLARQFYRQMAVLGARQQETLVAPAPLDWLCLTAGASRDPQTRTRLKANYDTRLHRTELVWTSENDGSDDDETFSADASAFEPDGLTFQGNNRRMMFTRLSHEIAHQLAFDCGLQKRGVMYPLWLAEGLATNFESPDDEVHFLGPNTSRSGRLRQLADRKALMSVSKLIAITTPQGLSEDDRIDFYAQAWGLFRYLAIERTSDLTAHLSKLASLPCGQRTPAELEEEVRCSFGPLPQLEKAWLAWLTQP